MRAIHLLIVSMLGLGGIATAVAADVAVSNGDANCTRQSSSDSAAAHDSGSSNSHGDATGLTHARAARSTPAPAASPTVSNGDGGVSTGGGSDASPRRASLGWQSLLPGSIQ
ncbi:MAG: hypothetical protein WA777_15910 [Rhodanobacter sp.]